MKAKDVDRQSRGCHRMEYGTDAAAQDYYDDAHVAMTYMYTVCSNIYLGSNIGDCVAARVN